MPIIDEEFLQTLNMTNRWKKTSEDVQAISAPKVIPQIFNLLSCLTVKNVCLHPNLNFSAGYLLLPLLHHYSRLCADHKAQLSPTPNERPRKRKYLKLKPAS